jgi:ATP-binding cassette, subfamily B, bacterial PglK
MLRIIRDILALLNGKEKRQFVWLSLAMILMALVEVVGIASIMPFMAVVGNPDSVANNQWLRLAYETGGFASIDHFLIFLGAVVLFFILASNAFKAVTTWFELKFINFRTYSLSRQLLYHYLNKPYVFFLNQNTSLMGKNLLHEINLFIFHVLHPVIQILAKMFVVFFIFGLLLFVDPLLAVMIVITLGGGYIVLYTYTQRKLGQIGEARWEANAQRFKITGEALGGIKDLKILGREPVLFQRFSHHAREMAEYMATHDTISQLPRFIMEALAFGGILLIVLYYLIFKGEVEQILPILALYAFAGYRLMPALQSTFSAVTNVRFNLAALDQLLVELDGKVEMPADWRQVEVPLLPFRERIQLEKITFAYPGAAHPVIQDLSLSIGKNTSIGIVGATGSGKTTIVDVILGLLAPAQGRLKIDGVSVTAENLPNWQRNLGYVPQMIFLCDDTVASNIALGIPSAEIDKVSVERAARIANLHDFVMRELPQGYETVVGERGVRLSGGQRQRIGIARALYHDPEVLIMDEATSALDGITEQAVIHAISELAGKKTTITIAHRLTTLQECDVVYVMDKGRVVEQGTYSELTRSSSRFQAMARAGVG